MKTLIFIITILLISPIVYANELSQRFHDWYLFKTKINNQNTCYLISSPIKTEGNFIKRAEPFFLVVDNFNNNIDEISISSGFNFNESSNVELSFGIKKFYLLPYQSIAWAVKKNDDIDIIKEMQKNADMLVTSIAWDGKIAIDTYSLIGFANSYNKLKQNCLEK